MKRNLFMVFVITPLVGAAVLAGAAIATLGTVTDLIYERRMVK